MVLGTKPSTDPFQALPPYYRHPLLVSIIYQSAVVGCVIWDLAGPTDG